VAIHELPLLFVLYKLQKKENELRRKASQLVLSFKEAMFIV
jgi:RNAse (barnase) inhibitor barstar